MTAVADTVELRYLGFTIRLLDEHHVTILAPDGYRIVSGARMAVSSARNVIRGYRLKERLEQLQGERITA